jgi:hypothetical protein
MEFWAGSMWFISHFSTDDQRMEARPTASCMEHVSGGDTADADKPDGPSADGIMCSIVMSSRKSHGRGTSWRQQNRHYPVRDAPALPVAENLMGGRLADVEDRLAGQVMRALLFSDIMAPSR